MKIIKRSDLKKPAGQGVVADHFAFISGNDAITILGVASRSVQPLFIGPAVTHGCSSDASAYTPVCHQQHITAVNCIYVQVHTRYILGTY